MQLRPIASALLIATLISVSLPGCGRFSNATPEELIQRAKDKQAKGDINGGIIELKNAVQKDPNNAQARFLLGTLYVTAKQGNAAEKELTKARDLGYDQEALKLPLGEALLLVRDYKRLLEDIQPAEKTSATNKAKIWVLHGNADMGLRNWKQACDLFERAQEAEKTLASAHWGLAKCAVIDDKPDLARTHLETALKLDTNNPVSWILLGDFERYSNNLQAAEKAYSAALKLTPNDIQGLAERANTYIFMGQPGPADADIKRLRQLAPKHFLVDYLQALQYSRTNKPDDALSAVQKALQLNPDYPPAVYLLGTLQHQRGENEQAAKTLGQYLRMLPGDRAARTLLARVQLDLNQPDQSLALLQPMLQAHPTDAILLSLASQAQLQQKNPAAANLSLQKAVAENPGNAGLHSQFGLVKLESGDINAAISELNTAAQLDKKRAEPLVALTLVHLKQKQFDLALDTLAKLHALLPNNPVAYNLGGIIHLNKGDKAEARKQFEHALELQPNLMAAVMNLAQMDMRDGKPEAAEARYKKVLAKDSNNLLALLTLADLARAQKNEPIFLSLLNRAIKAHPSAPQAHLALALHYLSKNEKQKALSEARQALTANPSNMDALDTMGQVQLALGDKENAKANFARMVQLAPNSHVAHYQYALAQIALKDTKGTRSSLERALKLQPGYSDAQAALAHLALQQKKPDEAMSIARQMQQQHPTLPAGFILEGDGLMASKLYAAAAKRYEQAYRVAPTGPLAVKLHAAYTASGQPAEGQARLQQWVKQNPGDSMASLFLASAYAQAGQRKAAIAQYEQIVRADPNNAMVLNNLAWQLFLDGDARAMSYAERAHKLAPNDPATLDTLGWLLVQKKQTARGLDLLKQAASKAPQIAEIRYHLAIAYANSGQKAQAKQELSALLRSGNAFPQRKEAQTLLDQL